MIKMKNKKYFISFKTAITLVFIGLIFSACSFSKTDKPEEYNGFDTVIEYLEEYADYVNSSETPFFISAPEIFENLDSNYLVIDIRDINYYEDGHIINSINVKPDEIVAFFENIIHAPNFDKIAIVCNAGYKSAFVAMGMRYLGYENVFPLRNGLSSWDYSIAKNYRLKHISDSHLNKLDTIGYPKNKAGDFPIIKTYHKEPYKILRQRIIEILSEDLDKYFIEFDEITENSENYYIMSYWPEARYNSGHLTGSVRYQPRKSLRSDEYLNTLPIDKPTVIQCYMGNHSNFVAMYLNILGYDAKSLIYGANNFIFTTIKNEERPGRFFTLEKDVFNFPLVGLEHKEEVEVILPDPGINIQGGC